MSLRFYTLSCSKPGIHLNFIPTRVCPLTAVATELIKFIWIPTRTAYKGLLNPYVTSLFYHLLLIVGSKIFGDMISSLCLENYYSSLLRKWYVSYFRHWTAGLLFFYSSVAFSYSLYQLIETKLH